MFICSASSEVNSNEIFTRCELLCVLHYAMTMSSFYSFVENHYNIRS